MGSCNTSHPEKTVVSNTPRSIRGTQSLKSSKTGISEADLEREKQLLPAKFKDMPEWEGERYKGEGIKRMKGYKCEMLIDQLNHVRDEFWNLKTKEKLIWRNLRQACNMDDVRADQIVKQLGLKTVYGCINFLIDDNDHKYYIPNFCVNDPYFEKEIKQLDENQMPVDQHIKIFINDLYANKKTELNVNLNMSGQDLKELYYNTIAEDILKNKTRFFFGGVEIADAHKLCQHNIQDEYHIQVIKKSLID